jgi:hypothetical protein
MKKVIIKFKEIKIQPTNWYLDVIICKDKHKIAQFMHKRYGASVEYYEDELFTEFVSTISSTYKSECNGRKRIVMVLYDMNRGILVHELVHVLWHFSKNSGVNMCYDSQEWQAILFEYLYNECKSIK